MRGRLILCLGLLGFGLAAPSAGATNLRARSVTACSADPSSVTRGAAAILCPLTPGTLDRRADGAIRLRVRTVFTTAIGTRTVVERPIPLAAL